MKSHCRTILGLLLSGAVACGGSGNGGTGTGGTTGTGGNADSGADSTMNSSPGSGGTTGTGGMVNTGGQSSTAGGGNGGKTATGGNSGAGGDVAPPGFWDAGTIPAAKNVMTFVFLNRSNGKLADSEIVWSFKSGSISETHSLAAQSTYDMPANSSGRLYFYLCPAGEASCATDPSKSKYFDFIEHTIGATQYNGNTTRVDAFGIKIAMHLHCADGFDVAVGENYATFQEDRAVTFQRFLDAVPDEFKPLAQAPHAPYRIVEPGAEGFGKGGAYATYYDSFVALLWAANGLTIAKPGPNGSGLASYPDISAAIFRHVGDLAGTFDANGKLLDKNLWKDSSTFYRTAPANYYARFWHANALGGRAYGFPYDDVGSYSSYISHANPQSLLVAIGW